MAQSNKTLREFSRDRWVPTFKPKPTKEEIQLGCLLRIADATEVMSKNYQRLLDQLEWSKRQVESYKEKAEYRKHRIAGLKSRITVLLRKIEALEGQEKV